MSLSLFLIFSPGHFKEIIFRYIFFLVWVKRKSNIKFWASSSMKEGLSDSFFLWHEREKKDKQLFSIPSSYSCKCLSLIGLLPVSSVYVLNAFLLMPFLFLSFCSYFLLFFPAISYAFFLFMCVCDSKREKCWRKWLPSSPTLSLWTHPKCSLCCLRNG